MAINKTDARKAHYKRWRKENDMIVKGFKNKELNEAFITTPKIVCDYISAMQRVLDMSEETNTKAIAKIRKLEDYVSKKTYKEDTQVLMKDMAMIADEFAEYRKMVAEDYVRKDEVIQKLNERRLRMSSICRKCAGTMPDDRAGWEQVCDICDPDMWTDIRWQKKMKEIDAQRRSGIVNAKDTMLD